MKRFTILAAFFISISYSAIPQENLYGKWFMFSRNRIIQFTFFRDRLITNQLDWDLTSRMRNESDTQIIISEITANGNIYLCLQNSNDSTKKILLNTFKTINSKRQMIIVLNAVDTLFTDTTSIRQYIVYDTDKKYGLTLYSETEIQRLKQQKQISEMSSQDFKTYAGKIIQFKAELDSLSHLPNPPNGLLYYGYSMIRNILGQIGYNPLVTNEEYENFIKHFQNNPETKEIVSQLLQ